MSKKNIIIALIAIGAFCIFGSVSAVAPNYWLWNGSYLYPLFGPTTAITVGSCSGCGGGGITNAATSTALNTFTVATTTSKITITIPSTGSTLYAPSTTIPVAIVSSVNNQTGAISNVVTSTSGHINLTGAAPTLGSCASGSMDASSRNTDNAGTIDASGVTLSCVLNFAVSFAYVPSCTVADNSTAITGDISSVSASSVTFNFSASIGGGFIYYHCL